MEHFCIEVAVHFLLKWLLVSLCGIASYAWEIFQYVCDRHIHKLWACDVSKGGFPLSRNFYVRTDINFNWLYVRKLK